MKVYLTNEGGYTLFEGNFEFLEKEFEKRNISIGDGCYLGDGCYIGDWCQIGNGCYIGSLSKIGDGCRIGDSSRIWERSRIGAGSQIGTWIQIGERSQIGEGSIIPSKYGSIVLGPIGSRQDMMTAYINKNVLMIATGCFIGEASEFLKRVEKTHGDNVHSRAYHLAVKFVMSFFTEVSNEVK